jgi:uncharacterized phage protein (TIGR02218 family)
MPIDASSEFEGKYLAVHRKPTEIYKIWNDFDAYYLTSGDVPITYDGNIYQPAYLKRSGTERSADMNVSAITIQCHYLLDEIVRYLGTVPLATTWLTINRIFRDQDPIEVMNYFVGTIESVPFKGQHGTITANGVEKMFRVPVPKYRYQPRCNHELYTTVGPQCCGVDKDLYAVNEVVQSVSGSDVTLADLSSYEDGYFSLGYIQPPDSGPIMIAEHVGNVLTLRYPPPLLSAADAVIIYPGCDHSPTACKEKFNNLGNSALDRFFGFIYVPDDNPCTWTD